MLDYRCLFLAGFLDVVWAAILVLVGVDTLLVGISVMKPTSQAPPPAPVLQNAPPAHYPPPSYYPSPTYYPAPPQPPQVIRDREVIHEVVKIRCGHSGNLVDQGVSNCPNCAAPMR